MLSSITPKYCRCYDEEEGLHVVSKVEEETPQFGDNGRFKAMIDNNAHPSYQLVNQQLLVSKCPTLLIISPWI
jgi:hypothetical protein